MTEVFGQGWDGITRVRHIGHVHPTDNGAIVSTDGWYRYLLWRIWDRALPRALFIMLNPSTADATEDDHTVRKCRGFARRLNAGGIEIVNLFAFRATKPSDLLDAAYRMVNINGPENDATIEQALRDESNDPVVCAWGASAGALTDVRAPQVLDLVKTARRTPTCLGRTKDAKPLHPLTLPYTATLSKYEIP